MRLLHVTDTHMGLQLKTWCAPRGYRRADDCEAALAEALEPAMREEVDVVVHSGDVFDRSQPPPEAVEATARLLERASRRVPVVIMPGNHDRRGLLRHLTPGPGLHIVDEATQVQVAGVNLAMVPYAKEAEVWAYDAAAVADGADLVVAHQSFHGAAVPGYTFRVGRHLETVGEHHMPKRGPSYVLCGHIHPRQITTVGRHTIVQPGSSERTSFREAGQTKGYAIWELGREVGWRWVDLNTRPMHHIKTVVDALAVTPGSLVRMGTDAPVDLVDIVGERGGFFGGRRPRRLPTRAPDQLALFG